MNFFGILSRYVSWTFLKSFALTFLCIFSIIVLFDFAELQRRIGSKDVGFDIKLNMVLLKAPHLIEQVLPFLVFGAALFVFWRLNRSHELVVFRSMGVSLWRLIIPISLTALAIGFIDLTVFNPLSNAMMQRYEKLEKRHVSHSKEDIKVSSTGLWLSEKKGPNQVIYRASKIDLKKLELKDLNIIVTSPENKFVERFDAKKGKIVKGEIELWDGWKTVAGKTPEPFTQLKIPSALNKAKIESLKVNRTHFSFWNLPSYIHLLKISGLHSLKYQMSWHALLAGCFWVGAMVFLAAAFSCRPFRQGKTILLILTGLVVGFILYFFKDMTFAIGASGGLPPIIAAWLPPLLTLMVGSVLVFYQEDG